MGIFVSQYGNKKREIIKKTINDSSNSKDPSRFRRYAVDRSAAARYGDVLQLYLHGYPLTHQRPDAGDPWLGFYSLRHDAGF